MDNAESSSDIPTGESNKFSDMKGKIDLDNCLNEVEKGKDVSAENAIASELHVVDPKRKIKKNQLNVFVQNNRTIPKHYVPNNKPLEVSNNIRTFKPIVLTTTKPILATSKPKYRDQNPDPINKNKKQARPKIPHISNPPAPTISNAMVTKLRA